MCEWCENGRLIKRTHYNGKDGEPLFKDYSKYLHKPDNPPYWLEQCWDYQHNKALSVLQRELKKDGQTLSREKRQQLRIYQGRKPKGPHCAFPGCRTQVGKLCAARRGFCSVHHQRYKRWCKRVRLVEYAGGKCQRCGIIPDSVSGFDFHHIDPGNKEFSISTGINLQEDLLKKEVDKCVLLCATCHRVEEQGVYDKVYKRYNNR